MIELQLHKKKLFWMDSIQRLRSYPKTLSWAPKTLSKADRSTINSLLTHQTNFLTRERKYQISLDLLHSTSVILKRSKPQLRMHKLSQTCLLVATELLSTWRRSIKEEKDFLKFMILKSGLLLIMDQLLRMLKFSLLTTRNTLVSTLSMSLIRLQFQVPHWPWVLEFWRIRTSRETFNCFKITLFTITRKWLSANRFLERNLRLILR